jgi:hypothetical protein
VSAAEKASSLCPGIVLKTRFTRKIGILLQEADYGIGCFKNLRRVPGPVSFRNLFAACPIEFAPLFFLKERRVERKSGPYKKKSLLWIKLKKAGRSGFEKSPQLKSALVLIWRISKWFSLNSKRNAYDVPGEHAGPDIDTTYYVSPSEIRYSSLKEFDRHNFEGKIIGGDWDKLKKPFEEQDVYVALKEVCQNGKQWKDTLFYQRMLDKIAKGLLPFGCKNKAELDRQCESLSSLYQRIKSTGYKAQAELAALEKDDYPLNLDDEIVVSIGRYGDLLFSNGAHRLAIAKLLGVEKIPIKIAVRHPQWVHFKKEIVDFAGRHRGKIYQPITHPDLSQIPAHHGSADRFQMIKENLGIRKGNLLDLGANWGYFCNKFEEEGLSCVAAENSVENLYFLKKIRRANKKSFKIVAQSFLESNEILSMEADVVLALNVFHHFLKNKPDYLRLVHLLRNLKMKEMFFEPHASDDRQMIGAYKKLSEEEFVKFIIDNSMLSNAECISAAHDGRKIYKLS